MEATTHSECKIGNLGDHTQKRFLICKNAKQLFEPVPSTLAGACTDPDTDTGAVNEAKEQRMSHISPFPLQMQIDYGETLLVTHAMIL